MLINQFKISVHIKSTISPDQSPTTTLAISPPQHLLLNPICLELHSRFLGFLFQLLCCLNIESCDGYFEEGVARWKLIACL